MHHCCPGLRWVCEPRKEQKASGSEGSPETPHTPRNPEAQPKLAQDSAICRVPVQTSIVPHRLVVWMTVPSCGTLKLVEHLESEAWLTEICQQEQTSKGYTQPWLRSSTFCFPGCSYANCHYLMSLIKTHPYIVQWTLWHCKPKPNLPTLKLPLSCILSKWQ